MGCGSSSYSAVYPLTDSSDEDEVEVKHDDRGDSAVSKVTADSGVEMENNLPASPPGVVPEEVVELKPEICKETEVEKIPDEAAPAAQPQQESPVNDRPKSSDILEDLLSYGIIPEGNIRERGSGAAYNIMVGEKESTMRKPPARLESLKARKAQSLFSKEEFDEKMRLAEERRKVKEDELKTRLRTKSARVRGPPLASGEEEESESLSPIELVKLALAPELTAASVPQSLTPLDPVEGVEWFRKGKGDGKDLQEKGREVSKTGNLGEGGEDREEKGQAAKMETKEENNQMEEFEEDKSVIVAGKLESDLSFQHPDDKEEIF